MKNASKNKALSDSAYLFTFTVLQIYIFCMEYDDFSQYKTSLLADRCVKHVVNELIYLKPD